MTSLDFARALEDPMQASQEAFVPHFRRGFLAGRFADSGALGEAETSEFAARLLDAQTEREVDHLLGAIMTHAAHKAGGTITPAIGDALGRYLKRIARNIRPAGVGATVGCGFKVPVFARFVILQPHPHIPSLVSLAVNRRSVHHLLRGIVRPVDFT